MLFDLEIEPTISIGHILMSFTVAISSAALVLTWRKDRRDRRSIRATERRKVLTDAISVLKQYEDACIQLYDHIELVTVDADVLWIKSQDQVAVRDMYWKSICDARVDVLNKRSSLNVADTSARLGEINQPLQDVYDRVWQVSQDIEKQSNIELRLHTQSVILDQKEVVSSCLGNLLREKLVHFQRTHTALLDEIMRPVVEAMRQAASLSDSDLLTWTWLKASVAEEASCFTPKTCRERYSKSEVQLGRQGDVFANNEKCNFHCWVTRPRV